MFRFWVFFRKVDRSFEEISWILSKSLELANFLSNASEIVKFSKSFKIWFFWRRDVSRKKILIVLKIAKGSKFAVECDWNSTIAQIVQNLGFFLKKNRWVFRGKIFIFFEFAKDSKLAMERVSYGSFFSKMCSRCSLWGYLGKKAETTEHWKNKKTWWRRSVFFRRIKRFDLS